MEQPQPDPAEELRKRLERMEGRLRRARSAQLQAERIGEEGLRALYEKQEALNLLQRIATSANASNDPEEALAYALEQLCRYSQWDFGNVYFSAERSPQRMVPGHISYLGCDADLSRFQALTAETDFLPGTGLPGRVFTQGRPAWIADVTEDDNFPRAAAARACGLRAALGVPVLVGRSVAAVLEFYSHRVLPEDPALMELMAQVGTTLGRVLERKQAEDKLIYDASHDALTGLPNRLLFVDRLQRAVSRQRQQSAHHLAVLFIDLDRFKLVNDSLGHSAGDDLIRQIGRRFADLLARQKARGAPHTLARLGGDEFTVLLEDLEGAQEAVDVAERILGCLDEPLVVAGQSLRVSASIGIASSTETASGTESLLHDADLAMYRAKSLGSNRIELFDGSLHQLALRRLQFETELRGAVERGELELHYQPITHASRHQLAGFEALLRWRISDDQLLGPDEFISIAELSGLIVPIGAWVLREACETLVRLQQLRPQGGDLTMSVNVSPVQFAHPDFFGQLEDTLRASGIDPKRLKLEITESMAVKDRDRASELLRRVTELGVRVSIDDFGTGYSSLSHLHELPLDTLKIDRSFVKRISSGGGRSIICTIIALARNLGLDVIAEGAESLRDVEELQGLGCDLIQGRYFSPPLSAAAAERYLLQQPA